MKQFRNLTIYKLNPKTKPTPERLKEAFSNHRFKEILETQQQTAGFAAPYNWQQEDEIIYQIDDGILCRIHQQIKMIPPYAEIKKEAEKQLGETFNISKEKHQDVYNEIFTKLVKNTLPKEKDYYILFTNNYLIINQVGKNADLVMSNLIRALGGLEATLLSDEQVKENPKEVLTRWVEDADQSNGNFAIGSCCQLVSISTPQKLKISNMTIADFGEYTQSMAVKEIQLIWGEMCEFTLTDKLQIKSFKNLDFIEKSEDEDQETADKAAQILFAHRISQIADDLLKLFGGLKDENHTYQSKNPT